MSTYYSDQYDNAYVQVPSVKINPGEVSGEVKCLIATHTFEANAFLTTDSLYMAKLPANSRILDAKLYGPSLGTTGILDVGTSSDPDCIIDGADFGGQAAIGTPVVGGSALMYDYSSELDIIVTATEATDAALGDEIKLVIFYQNY